VEVRRAVLAARRRRRKPLTNIEIMSLMQKQDIEKPIEKIQETALAAVHAEIASPHMQLKPIARPG
jgi:hypothetical protein